MMPRHLVIPGCSRDGRVFGSPICLEKQCDVCLNHADFWMLFYCKWISYRWLARTCCRNRPGTIIYSVFGPNCRSFTTAIRLGGNKGRIGASTRMTSPGNRPIKNTTDIVQIHGTIVWYLSGILGQSPGAIAIGARFLVRPALLQTLNMFRLNFSLSFKSNRPLTLVIQINWKWPWTEKRHIAEAFFDFLQIQI